MRDVRASSGGLGTFGDGGGWLGDDLRSSDVEILSRGAGGGARGGAERRATRSSEGTGDNVRRCVMNYGAKMDAYRVITTSTAMLSTCTSHNKAHDRTKNSPGRHARSPHQGAVRGTSIRRGEAMGRSSWGVRAGRRAIKAPWSSDVDIRCRSCGRVWRGLRTASWGSRGLKR